MEILLILGTVLFLIFSSLVVKGYQRYSILNAAGHLAVLLLSFKLVAKIIYSGVAVNCCGIFYADALSGVFIITISVINFASALYSISYIEQDIKDGHIKDKKAKVYYLLFNLFALSMFLVPMVNNLGFVWVAIEMTTLVSAFLVGFYNKKTSIEAAWKYIIICSVGITLALFGTILFYYAASRQGGVNTLNWLDMAAVAGSLDPNIVKVAFIFVLIGYGTKAGLAPMHTWLPDAHSQAPAPISALLSGVLLKTALYAILRFFIITNNCLNSQFTSNLFIIFGLLSLAIAAGFILVQKDIKRLLAYSSVEHIGIISLGIGFGGVVGLFGALLHIFNHAVTKSLMFFGVGNIVKRYGTNNLAAIRGVITAMPFTGVIVLLGVFALAGSVPFSIFISEIVILISGFTKGAYFAASLALVLIGVIFAALVNHFSGILFGRSFAEMPKIKEPLSTKVPLLFLFTFVVILGFVIPGFFFKLFYSAIGVINGNI